MKTMIILGLAMFFASLSVQAQQGGAIIGGSDDRLVATYHQMSPSKSNTSATVQTLELFESMGKGQLQMVGPGKTKSSIFKISEILARAELEKTYLEVTYGIDKIASKSVSQENLSTQDLLRHKYDQLLAVKKLLSGVHSIGASSAIDIYWLIIELHNRVLSKSSYHVDYKIVNSDPQEAQRLQSNQVAQ